MTVMATSILSSTSIFARTTLPFFPPIIASSLGPMHSVRVWLEAFGNVCGWCVDCLKRLDRGLDLTAAVDTTLVGNCLRKVERPRKRTLDVTLELGKKDKVT
ncbi:hypothetical protein MAR_028235 [Mya arenaria]|uniref:Uncharacterized protein n=1 Tax=Mya arenaria TaxID=6604 RepID=A0ABY7DGT4_MYAAR|nr:hypothetical protein MAR_028235 [Mya arenaria]